MVVNVMLIPIMRGSKAISQKPVHTPLWQLITVAFATAFNTHQHNRTKHCKEHNAQQCVSYLLDSRVTLIALN